MSLYFHLSLHKPSNYSIVEINRIISNKFPRNKVTYTLKQLPNGEILFICASILPKEVDLLVKIQKKIETLAEVILYRTFVDENEAPWSRYLVCFNTKLQHAGRSPKNDAVMVSVDQTLREVNTYFDTTYHEGYLFLNITAEDHLDIDLREKIKMAVEIQFPGSFVFEHYLQ